MRKSLLILIAATIAVSLNAWATANCGNDCPGGPGKCDCQGKGGGANPLNPYSGSVQREITDLEMFGGIGEEKLAFKRLTTSRYKPGIPTPLGTGGSWRHSYYWNIVPNGTNQATGGEIIHVDYPDGTEHDFYKETTSSLYLTGVSSTQERIEQSSTNSSQYYLWFPDGRRLSFTKIVTDGVTKFRPLGMYDKHNNFYQYTWALLKNRITRVTEPGGRYLQINYGSIGNFPVGNITFTYTNPTATSVWLAGDFNDWGGQTGDANPLTNNNGTWSITVPLQLGATYQYKFIVNGNVWVSDPNNPNTIPAGGPATGNNSAIKNADIGTTLGQTPIAFSYTNASANSVAVVGSFNNWNPASNPLVKNGDTWTATVNIAKGSWQYKFVVNNTTPWITDPSNQFTKLDGYGGYNSVLNVGPLDEAITSVQASDGRYVTYTYDCRVVAFSVYSTLLTAAYSDNTAAHYTYSTPTTNLGRPTLATADDPRYRGPMTRIAYTYQNNGFEGFISEEQSLADQTVVAHLDPSDDLHRQITTGPQAINFDFLSGHAATQIDSLQRKTTFEFFDSGWGMPSASREWDGSTPYTTSYERTLEFGNVTKITLPDTKTQITHYPNLAKPFFPDYTTDENGHTTNFTRDSNGRPTVINYPDSSYETFNYDDNNFGLLISHRLRNGYTESFTYYGPNETGGKRGDIKTHTNAAGELMTYTYDAAGRKVSQKDGKNHFTYYQYNERGQVTLITFHDTKTQSFGYDDYGNKRQFTNELDKSWYYDPDQFNRVSDVTDPLIRTTHYNYDVPVGGSTCSCSVKNYPTSITYPSGKKTVIGYNTEWEKISETVGAETADAATTQFLYDDLGRMFKMIDPMLREWDYEYNSRKWRTKATDPNGNYTEWTYDYVGNKKTEKRSGDTVAVQYDYDDSNHLTDITDQANQNTHMTRDGDGNMLTLRDARPKTYTFTYDGMNRKKTLVYPGSGGTETWHYDEAGRLDYYVTRVGQTQTFSYDNRNREADFTWSDDTPAVTKTYDDAGHLLTLISNVSCLSYTYDAAGQLSSETEQILPDQGPMSVLYYYDLDGNRSHMLEFSGGAVTYLHTGRRQIKEIADGWFGDLESASSGVDYVYDLNGNRTERDIINGGITTYSYDLANRLEWINHGIARFDYGYNTMNNRTSRRSTINNVQKTDVYGPDATDQITSVKYNFHASTNTQDRSVTYGYDSVGNRTSVVENGVTTTSYTPNDLNQYTAVGGDSPEYDDNGNLASTGEWTYEYDAQNRLKIASGSTMQYVFAYDGQNRCVSRQKWQRSPHHAWTLIDTTNHYYDAWNVVEDQDSGQNLKARYIHGAQVDEMIKVSTAGGDTYYLQDALQTVVALTDSGGNVVERYTYDIYGAPAFFDSTNQPISASAVDNRFLFTGREYLADLASYDYRNRVYSPTLGRFLQTDPERFAARDVNLYRYVFNKPTNAKDPSGLGTHCYKGSNGWYPVHDSPQPDQESMRTDWCKCYAWVQAYIGYLKEISTTCSDDGAVVVDQQGQQNAEAKRPGMQAECDKDFPDKNCCPKKK